MSKIIFRRFLLLLWLGSSFYGLVKGATPASTESATPAVPGPAAAPSENPRQGTMLVVVTYGPDGKVTKCQVVRSNAPFPLESATVDYIREHWVCPFFAGDTLALPIVFDPVSDPKYWNEDMPTPPNLFPYDGLTHHVTLRLTFGSDGWVNKVTVAVASDIESADAETAFWIKIHWHHTAFANQVIDAPFEFRPPPSPPPPPAAKPVEPAPPPEQVPIPAIRAQ